MRIFGRLEDIVYQSEYGARNRHGIGSAAAFKPMSPPYRPSAGNFQNLFHKGINVGDRVLFGKYAGTEVKVNGEDLLVMREDDIMAVIEG